jgi:hypothetical protein
MSALCLPFSTAERLLAWIGADTPLRVISAVNPHSAIGARDLMLP